jgi:hypothetical protein
MALSVPSSLGSKVPVSIIDWECESGDGSWDPDNMRFCELRSCGIERAAGSCALGCDDSAESIDI